MSDPARDETQDTITRFLHALNEDRAADAQRILDIALEKIGTPSAGPELQEEEGGTAQEE